MNEYLVFIVGLVLGLIFGTLVYEFFTYPVMRVIFRRHQVNGDGWKRKGP